MRPSHIRVFDGLRVTAEHIEHFQGSLHLAMRDLRQIAGLGRVHQGFSVTPAATDAVQLAPGLAFDTDGECLVLDEARTIELDWLNVQTSLYLSLQHESIEEGEREGRFTLVFDSIRVLQSAEPPGPKDKAVSLARLDRDEKFELGYRVTELGNGEPSQDLPETETATDKFDDVSTEGEGLHPAADDADEDTSVDSKPKGEAADTTTEELLRPIPVEVAAPSRSTDYDASEHPDAIETRSAGSFDGRSVPTPGADESFGEIPAEWGFQQGLVHLPAEPLKLPVSKLLASAMRDRLVASGPSEHAELAVVIVSHRIPVTLDVRSLTLHGRLNVLWIQDRGQPREAPTSVEALKATGELPKLSSQPTEPITVLAEAGPQASGASPSRKVQALVNGEATIKDSAIEQFGTVHVIRASPEGTAPRAAAITTDRLASWPLSEATTTEDVGLPEAWPPSLALDIRLEHGDRNGVALAARAVWSGPINSRSITELQQRFNVTWDLVLAWKAQGIVGPKTNDPPHLERR